MTTTITVTIVMIVQGLPSQPASCSIYLQQFDYLNKLTTDFGDVQLKYEMYTIKKLTPKTYV